MPRMPGEPEPLRIDDATTLVPSHMADGRQLLDAIQRNMAELMPWMPWATGTYSQDSLDAFMEQSRKSWSEGTGHGYVIAVDGVARGTVGLHRLTNPAKAFEIGYWLDREGQGRGIVTRSCEALLEESFTGLGANLVEIGVAPANSKSLAVAQRLGMMRETVLRQRIRAGNGEMQDRVVFSITADEWRARTGGTPSLNDG